MPSGDKATSRMASSWRWGKTCAAVGELPKRGVGLRDDTHLLPHRFDRQVRALEPVGAKEVGATGVRADEIVLVGGRRVRVAGALTLEQLARLLQVVEGGSVC